MRIKKIKLISEDSCFRILNDGEEIKQTLSICSDGRIYFNSYNVSFEEGPFRWKLGVSKRFKITEAKAEFLISAINLCLDEWTSEIMVCDSGSWEAEIEYEDGTKKVRYSDMLDDLIVFPGMGISKLIRETLAMPNLFAFDGNSRNPIELAEDEAIFVKVSFDEIDGTYTYICEDNLVREYDDVIVPFGYENNLKEAVVEEVIVCKKEDAPYPYELCKKVRDVNR